MCGAVPVRRLQLVTDIAIGRQPLFRHRRAAIEVQRTAEALDRGDRAGLGRPVGMARFLDQMRSDDPVDDAQHMTHDLGPAGEQEAQGIRKTEHPLTHGLFGQHFVVQQGRALGHAPRPAARAKTTAFAAERNQMLDVAALATYPQEAMLQKSALKVILEFPLHIARQYRTLGRQLSGQCRVMLFIERHAGNCNAKSRGGIGLESDRRYNSSDRYCRFPQPCRCGFGVDIRQWSVEQFYCGCPRFSQ